MNLQLRLDPDWRERKGDRPYKYARVTSEGLVRPVRYKGLTRVVGWIEERHTGYCTVEMNETIPGFKKEN